MKSLILIATLAAGTSAFATSPEALMIAKISCLKGEVNTEVTTKMIGAVGSLTTEGGAMMLVMGADGKMKDGCGVISSSKNSRWLCRLLAPRTALASTAISRRL